MKSTLRFAAVLLAASLLASDARAQFGRPPIPAPRVPVGPHVLPPHGPGGQQGGQSDVPPWVMPTVIGGLAVVGLTVVGVRLARRPVSGGRIRITAVPPGEAPEAVRRAWVGLELPLARGESTNRRQTAFGIFSRRSVGTPDGYAVDGIQAVQLLAAWDAEAAQWWREHAPHVLVRGYQLIFPAASCEKLS